MPVEFLSDVHLERYGRFQGDPTPFQLAEYFVLTPRDLGVMVDLRHSHTRLGFALQLCTLRFLSTFLLDPTDVPVLVLRTLCEQLGLPDANSLPRYLERRPTALQHQLLIRSHLGYHAFEGLELLKFLRWLYARVRLDDERPIALFDRCTEYLSTRHVLLPGASVLARVIVKFRDHAARHLYLILERRLTEAQKNALEAHLTLSEGSHRTPYERLRFPPSTTSHIGMNAALERILTIRAVGVWDVNLSDVPEVRQAALSRYAEKTNAGTLARLAHPRRLATLLCYLQQLEKSATDDALIIFDALMNSWRLNAERQQKKKRLRTLEDLDDAALLIADALEVLFEEAVPDGDIRKVTFKRHDKDLLLAMQKRVRELATPRERRESEGWQNAVENVMRFFSRLLSTLEFESTPAASALMSAIRFLQPAEEGKRRSWKQAPRTFVPKRWESVVFPLEGKGYPDQRVYQLCVAHRLHQALKGREVFVPRSTRFGDPRAQLLTLERWQEVKREVGRSLHLPLEAKPFLETLALQLDVRYREVLERLPHNVEVRIEVTAEGTTVNLKALEKLAETPSHSVLNTQIDARLPVLDLPELLLEIHAATGCLDAFDLASEGTSRAADIHLSVAAVLVAQACNIGLKAVAQPGSEALNLHRLAWVQQNYFRPETLDKANVRLVNYHTGLELAHKWGGGEVASADGLRFVVPVRSIYTGYNSKYFGSEKGLTLYHFVSDQFSGFHFQTVPGTLRDSLYILSGLLENKTALQIKELMSDTAGYSDVVFGLFHLLGYLFSPRLRDLEGVRWWRMDRDADYGLLDGLSKKHLVKAGQVAPHWDDILRLVASLKLGSVKAPDLMRVLAREGNLSGLGRAIAEVGRVAKTLYLLNYIDQPHYRRRIGTQLNRHEGRNSLVRTVAHGHKGQLYEKYLAGLEEQLGALGFVVNCIVVWNTRYMQAALNWLEAMGEDTLEADVARLSPLKHKHINMLGRYHFELDDLARDGHLRPLRDPESLDTFELTWED